MDPNGVTPLAGLIQLETDEPVRITLQVSDGADNRTIEFAEFSSQFAVPLLGLKPATDYTIDVILTDRHNQQQVLTPALTVTTPALPADFPSINVLVSEPGLMEPGYTMMARFVRAAGDPGYTIIVDNAGQEVWYSTLAGLTNYQLDNGNLLYRTDNDVIEIDLLGNQVSRMTLADPGTRLTHDMYPTVVQTYLSITITQATVENFPTSETDPDAPRASATIEDNPIVEFDQQGNLLNIWPLVDILDTERIGYHSLNTRPAELNPLGFDWVHVNSVIHDPRDDSIIISARHQDAVIKFTRAGELKWILGPHENWSTEFQPFLLTPVGEPFEWQYHQHTSMITPTGTIILFDNGNVRASPFDGKTKTPASQNYSRAVEYAVNEENMEIRQVWEYGKEIAERLYSGRGSDANWLSTTGNVLITFGSTSHTGGVRNADLGLGEVSTRIIEVTHDTPVVKVFDLSMFDPDPEARIQVYRCERIPDLYPRDSDADGILD